MVGSNLASVSDADLDFLEGIPYDSYDGYMTESGVDTFALDAADAGLFFPFMSLGLGIIIGILLIGNMGGKL